MNVLSPPLKMKTANRFNHRAVAIATVAFCGCATYSERPIDLLEELRQLDDRGRQPKALTVASPAVEEWFPLRADIDLGDGLDIGEANALALFYSPELRDLRHQHKIAAAQLVQAGLLPNPEVFVGPRISTKSDDVIFPASISWELPLWGKRGAARGVARARLSAAEYELVETELHVLVRLRAAFIRAAQFTQSISILERQLERGEAVLDWIAALRQAGVADSVTLYLTQLEQDQARDAIARLKLSLDSTLRDIASTVGLMPSTELSLSFKPVPTALPPLPPVDARRQRAHPRVARAVSEYEAAESALALEVAKQYPSVRLGPEFEDDSGDASVGFGLGVRLPIFDRNRVAIAAAEERRAARKNALQQALLKLAHEEAAARAEWNVKMELLDTYRSGTLKNANDARTALDRRLESGQSDVLEVLATLRSLALVRQRELELQSEVAVSQLRAALAAGAVFRRPPTRNSEEGAE